MAWKEEWKSLRLESGKTVEFMFLDEGTKKDSRQFDSPFIVFSVQLLKDYKTSNATYSKDEKIQFIVSSNRLLRDLSIYPKLEGMKVQLTRTGEGFSIRYKLKILK